MTPGPTTKHLGHAHLPSISAGHVQALNGKSGAFPEFLACPHNHNNDQQPLSLSSSCELTRLLVLDPIPFRKVIKCLSLARGH